MGLFGTGANAGQQNFAMAPAIYFLFPETNGLTLEEIDHLFIQDGSTGIEDTASDSQSGEKRVGSRNGHASGVEKVA
jgi:hypothetical protein